MTFEISDAMVIAAARRRYEETWRHDDSANDSFGETDLGPWEEMEPEAQSWWLDEARADLFAALEVHVVRKPSLGDALDQIRAKDLIVALEDDDDDPEALRRKLWGPRINRLLDAETELELLQPVLEALDEWRTMVGDYAPASDRVRDLVAAYDDYLRLRPAEDK